LIVASLHIGEIILAKICGFFIDWRMPFALIVRDIMLPVMFIDALLIDEYVWHGEKIKIKEADEYMGLS
jgi:ceramide glucosyltransferase